MDNLKEIITIVTACLGFIATATGFLIPLVKNVKAKNKLTALNKLSTTLQSYMVDAESHSNFTGEEKKDYVLTKTNRYAIDNDIPYDEQALSAKVEDLVALSKEVNKRGTISTTQQANAAETPEPVILKV